MLNRAIAHAGLLRPSAGPRRRQSPSRRVPDGGQYIKNGNGLRSPFPSDSSCPSSVILASGPRVISRPAAVRQSDRLRWARDVVVVDSFSTDETVLLMKSFPNVRLFQRAFDSHARQWNYAVKDTGISTEWVLALDADYYLTNGFIREISQLTLPHDINGYTAAFKYLAILQSVWTRMQRRSRPCSKGRGEQQLQAEYGYRQSGPPYWGANLRAGCLLALQTSM
jgi:hypothetical protein